MATTSAISAWLIREQATTENRGTGDPLLRAIRTQMNVIIGVNSSATTNANNAIFTQKKPLCQ
jgi:hypothetical protein